VTVDVLIRGDLRDRRPSLNASELTSESLVGQLSASLLAAAGDEQNSSKPSMGRKRSGKQLPE